MSTFATTLKGSGSDNFNFIQVPLDMYEKNGFFLNTCAGHILLVFNSVTQPVMDTYC